MPIYLATVHLSFQQGSNKAYRP